MLNVYVCRWEGKISEGKHNSTFHGKANDQVEEESLLFMKEFHEHLETPVGNLNLVFSLTGMSELTQTLCVKREK